MHEFPYRAWSPSSAARALLLTILLTFTGCQGPAPRGSYEAVAIPTSFTAEDEEFPEQDGRAGELLEAASEALEERLRSQARELLDRRLHRMKESERLDDALEEARTKKARLELEEFEDALGDLDLERASAHLEIARELDARVIGSRERRLEDLRLANAHRQGEIQLSGLDRAHRARVIQGHLAAADLLLANDKSSEAYAHVTACLKVIRHGREEKLHRAALERIRKQVKNQSPVIVEDLDREDYETASQRLTSTLDSISELKKRQTGDRGGRSTLPDEKLDEILGLIQQGEFAQAEVLAESQDVDARELESLRRRIQDLREALETP